jgi:hypothetical protein
VKGIILKNRYPITDSHLPLHVFRVVTNQRKEIMPIPAPLPGLISWHNICPRILINFPFQERHFLTRRDERLKNLSATRCGKLIKNSMLRESDE